MSRSVVAVWLVLSLVGPLGVLNGPITRPARAADVFALPAFQAVWAAADQAVAAGEVARTWLWGPEPITAGRSEPYAGAPDGRRLVQYFDKARMEDNAWREPNPPWRVTNGLLVVEMVAGRLQLGDGEFEARAPARVNVAGDPGTGPSYADLGGLLDRPASSTGTTPITAWLRPGGQVVDGQPPPVAIASRAYVEATRHRVADPFWEFMAGPAQFDGNPFFATGLPITEPYWTEVAIQGRTRPVLLQAFERRVLTFTPGNTPGFTVEMGNVGRHYHEWRHAGPPEPPTPRPAPTPLHLRPTPLVVPAALAASVEAERLRPFANRSLNLPEGLTVSLFGLVDRARFAAFSPAGDLYVASPGSRPNTGRIVVLPDRDRDGVAETPIIFADGLDRVHSLAFHDGAVYAGETSRVVRLDDTDGDQRADRLTVIVPDLPAGGQHWTRTVAFGPDGKLYVSVGSSCNVCLEQDWQRATILQYNPDGSGGRVYARGLRNSVGLTWQPGAGRLFATENGRDWARGENPLGDDQPPEEINLIVDGGDYGWPRCHGASLRDPTYGQDSNACAGQTPPVVEMQAHSAPLGLTFVTSSFFPTALQGDVLVAFHGSWNRSVPTGYKLVRVPFRDGGPAGPVEDFLTGFQTSSSVWSRPVDVLFGPDGALYVTADIGGAIFRIAPMVGSP